MKALTRTLALLGCAAALGAALAACDQELRDSGERKEISGLIVESIVVEKPKSTFERTEAFSIGQGTVTATYIDGSKAAVPAGEVSATFTKDDGTGLADFKKAEADKTVKVTLHYTSGGKTVKTDPYDVTITKAVKSIEVVGVEKNYVYNPGALETAINKALDTAFDYKIKTIYDDGTHGILEDTSSCKIELAEQGGKKGVKVTYTSAVNGELSDFYTSDKVASAVKDFTVQSGVQYGETDFTSAYNAPTPDIVIPNGKTMVATFMNYGSSNEAWDNFNIEFFAPGGLGITLRADRWGWKFGEGTDYNNGVNIDTVEWQEANTELGEIGIIAKDTLNEKKITVIVENTGDNVIVDCTSQDVQGFKLKYTIPITSENAKNNTTLHFQEPASYIVFD